MAFNTTATSLNFLVLSGLEILYLDATSIPVKIYLYIFLQNYFEACKANQIDAGH